MGTKRRLIFLCIAMFLMVRAIAVYGEDLASYVNPLAGTNCHGHTTPAACRPFGMISPGPDTRTRGWDGCSGYHYSDSQIRRFSHTHLSGTGVASYRVVKIMPTTGNQSLGATSVFSHTTEVAEPGYYRVFLDSYNILAEMTSTKRAAIHKYTFPQSDSVRILLDNTTVRQVNDSEIAGKDYTSAWRSHDTYFYMKFSKSFADLGERYVPYSTSENEVIYVKVGISYVSSEQAKLNLDAEIPDWDFDRVRSEARSEWNNELGRIEVTGGSLDQKKTFYTALYHCMIHPQLASDVDGTFRGMDGEVHIASDYNHYTILSLWDTFRAEHPLLLLIRPDIQLDVVKTMLDDYLHQGKLPKWKLAYRETDCMIGTHADSVIVDSYMKGIKDFDRELAWHALNNDGMNNRSFTGAVTSETLEYAYDDFCIMKMAEALGKPEHYTIYRDKANNYKNVYDPYTKSMGGSLRDCYGYTEGNGWQWTWSVLHDIQGLIDLMEGDESFDAQLDGLYLSEPAICGYDAIPEIGNYAHTNEPSHHITYLYNYCGKPWKTQERVRQVMSFYSPDPHYGIDGNDDCGQISAWYVFSAMGFYPVTPGVPEYVIGSPIFDEVILHLSGGDFVLTVNNNSLENIYIQSATLNGDNWDKTYIPHLKLKGGNLVLNMGSLPNSGWGTAIDSRPYSLTNDTGILARLPSPRTWYEHDGVPP